MSDDTIAKLRRAASSAGASEEQAARMLDRLAEEGLLRRLPSGEYEITPAGRKRFARLDRVFG